MRAAAGAAHPGTPVTQVRLVAHAPTTALRATRCGAGDDDLDAAGRAAARALAGGRDPLGRPDVVYTGPAPAARQTAAALGHPAAAVHEDLAERDWGRWRGRPWKTLLTEDPAAVRWCADPAAAPPGGESVAALRARVGRWLGRCAARGGRVAAVTHPCVIRAALLVALDLPDAGYGRLDVAPLSITRLSWRAGWHLRLAPDGGPAGRRPALRRAIESSGGQAADA